MANAQDLFLDDLVAEIPQNLLNSKKIDLDVRSYAGMAPFTHKFRGELFYWFFESQSVVRPKDNPEKQPDKKQLEEIPLLIWLNGRHQILRLRKSWRTGRISRWNFAIQAIIITLPLIRSRSKWSRSRISGLILNTQKIVTITSRKV
ncbi:MAG: hypothetical protein D3910_23100, partial [Candidatus Electrothrix sp. ATG2]|nr:hypothetical protein [Candidatus Electrothrix sp. ATG2]